MSGGKSVVSNHKKMNIDEINSFKEKVEIIEKNKDYLLYKLLEYCLNEIDFDTANELCKMGYLSNFNEIQDLSMLCIGHIARVYGKLVDKSILSGMITVYENPDDHYYRRFYANVLTAADDLKTYLGIDKNALISRAVLEDGYEPPIPEVIQPVTEAMRKALNLDENGYIIKNTNKKDIEE